MRSLDSRLEPSPGFAKRPIPDFRAIHGSRAIRCCNRCITTEPSTTCWPICKSGWRLSGLNTGKQVPGHNVARRHGSTMRVLITGGTGFIGQSLSPRLAVAGHEVVILTRQTAPRLPAGAKSFVTRLDDVAADTFQAVINLAGAPTDTRWTEKRKRV